MKRFCLTINVFLAALTFAQAGQIGFDEKFGLAPDRTVPLKELIPGTQDYYYYHCLHYQHTGEFDKVNKLLSQWIHRHNHSQRVYEIKDRNALLTYPTNHKGSLDHIRHRLGLHFDHQKRQLDTRPNFPTRLDQNLIAWPTLQRREYSRHSSSLQGFEDTALDILILQKLNANYLRNLLNRIRRPDHPNMAQLVVNDLTYRYSGGFGSHPIHRLLLLSQLDECLKLKPDLIHNTNFINTYMSKLRPSEDVDWKHDPKVREAYYERMWAFVKRLSSQQNSLKVHTLFHRLAHDRSLGIYDRERFMTYIKLPRNVGYINASYIGRNENRHVRANLNANYKQFTMLATVRTDEPLVRDFLAHFLLNADNANVFDRYIESNYLRRVFAETKILNGIGDMERWYSLLSPSEYQTLKERIDIDFLPTNKEVIASGDAVSLKVAVKHVKKLIVKTYEINTVNFYRDKKTEITTAIDLDGLVANQESVANYKQAPLRRHVETFTFPQITKPGVYVVELIGNGKSSRAVVRKGRLSFAERQGSAGHVFTVFNDRNERVKDAAIWMDGHEYKAEDSGEIAAPFSTSPRTQKIIVTHHGFSELHSFNHAQEVYRLTAGFYADRESLLDGETANLVVRAQLLLNSRPVDIELLEDIKLTLASTDKEGIRSSKEIKDFKLHNDKESTYEFKVPEELSALSFSLRGKIQNVSKAKKEDVSASGRITVNGIDRSLLTEDMHLRHTAGRYIIEILGKTGEMRKSRPVHIDIKHHDFKQTLRVTLMTDKTGRVDLGLLKDIDYVTAQLEGSHQRKWNMVQEAHSHMADAHARLGDPIMVPYMPAAPEKLADVVSLLEKRGNTFVRDVRTQLRLQNGFLVIDDLEAGDYSLYFKRTKAQRTIRITAGVRDGMHAVSRDRQLELGNSRPLQIVSVTPNQANATLAVKLRHATKNTRVHVTATRYIANNTPYSWLGRPVVPGLGWARTGLPITQYLSGRNIGDEYRYILERKYAKKHPGNMLRRPSLLLNPWSLRKTDTGTDEARKGEVWRGVAGGRSPGRRGAASAAYGGYGGAGGGRLGPNLDFLPDAALVLSNLKPDENGVVTVDLKDIGPRQQVHVVAINGQNAAYRELALSPSWSRYRDLRMARILDPTNHFAEQKLITIAEKSKPFVLKDARTSDMEVYDSLARVYGLFATLNADATFKEFAFILGWPELKDDRKRSLYSKYACHELSFFLYRKDPQFFKTVIIPYLKNKKDKTFMDHWLLGDNLSAYLQPWSHGRMNMVERVLLGQTIKTEHAAAARHVEDRFDLVPPNIEQFNHLFKTAIQGSALDVGGGYFGDVGAAEPGFLDGDAGADPFAADDMAFDAPAEVAATAPSVASFARSAGKKMKGQAKPQSMVMKESLKRMDKLAEEVEEIAMEEAEGKSEDYARDRARRQAVRQLYRKLDKTEEWVENNYYHQPIEAQLAALVPVCGFWKDYAAYDGKGTFLSVNMAEASRNFTEMMFALSVLDLPFTSPEHKSDVDGVQATLTPAESVVIFHKEVNPATKVPARQPLLVSQNFFAQNDRYRHEHNERFDKFVTKEFLFHNVYGCQVVLTNPTSTQRKVDILLQIPKGALPVNSGFFTRSFHVVIGPYATQKMEYYFYFPFPGQYEHFPVHVAQHGKLIAFHEPFAFNVVAKLINIDTESWDYISQHGSSAQVIRYLRDNNIDRLDLELIAFRMRDKAFFNEVIPLLDKRHVYHATLWSYGIYHDIVPAIREYLQGSRFATWVGTYIDSKLLTLDPVSRHGYQHKEYWPLVNARTYQLGANRKILNAQFFGQYMQFMKYLTYRPQLTQPDKAAVTYYMLLQDRVDEGLSFFDQIDPKAIPSVMPYDYMKAYLSFYRGDPKQARIIASTYKDHPVDRWRNRFTQILAQAKEIEGGKAAVIDTEDRDQRQAQLADTAPSFEFKVEDRVIAIQHQNIETCRVNYYLMDIELLFSKKPFVQGVSGQFSVIQPNETTEVKLGKKGKRTSLDLPKAYRDSNVMVEIVANGIRKTQAYYPHSLGIQIMENYGQLRITHEKSGDPLTKVYVKAYARMKDGTIKFYKDGYTDLRGRFDYTSLNTNELDFVDRFALLIMSEQHGAVVREAAPPKR